MEKRLRFLTTVFLAGLCAAAGTVAMPVIPDHFDTSACLRVRSALCGTLDFRESAGPDIRIPSGEGVTNISVDWETGSFADRLGEAGYLATEVSGQERSGYKAVIDGDWLFLPVIELMDKNGHRETITARQFAWTNEGGYRYHLMNFRVPEDRPDSVIVGVRLDYLPMTLNIVRDVTVKRPLSTFAIPDLHLKVEATDNDGHIRTVARHVEPGRRVTVNRRMCTIMHGRTTVDFGSIGLGETPSPEEVLRRAVTPFAIRCTDMEEGSAMPLFDQVFLANDRGTLLNSSQNLLKIGNGLVIEASGNNSRTCGKDRYRFDSTPNAFAGEATTSQDGTAEKIELHWRLCRDPEAETVTPGRFEAGATVWFKFR